MNVDAFLAELRAAPGYAEQIVHTHEQPARDAVWAEPAPGLDDDLRPLLDAIGIERLYCHQAEALRAVEAGNDLLVITGTASGKSLCYLLPLVRLLRRDPSARALLLFPTKALCQDQFRATTRILEASGLGDRLAGVLDGDTPAPLRRKLRDRGAVIFSNPDMIHAALMPQHGRWAEFLGSLSLLVLDELHVYSGIFGSNMALLLQRFFRVCRHYGATPTVIACSATIANPAELFTGLTGRTGHLVERDGSPRGRRVYVFWNPPQMRATTWRSRRSANVEAHELMALLIAKGVPTITFSKAKMTAEMIHRYVCERLLAIAPGQVSKVTPYRGGYLPHERRDIEKRLFCGELLGVSTTPALELGIDVGGLEASILVGYPGTRASFYQQSGRAGRKGRDSVVFLIGLDTSINQYIMSNPEYIYERGVERAVIDPENPFVVTGHLRCATQEIPLPQDEVGRFGPHAELVLNVLNDNLKVQQIGDCWYHAASEIPQHDVSLRAYADANVVIEDAENGVVLGEVNRFDAEPILHPEAIYMHRGDTFRIVDLDLDKNIARAKREEVDYYTQPLGGTDIHHIDRQLREKPFGTGKLFWGEVTAYFNTFAYEKIHFYSLDAVSRHGLELPTMVLETMAFWLVPPEDLMEAVRRDGLDTHSGLRGIGYATRMLLPLFMTCDTLDFSHTVGSVNSPWNAIFIYERYPHGLGFSEKAYERAAELYPRVLESIATCPCTDGCPCCVGKPLRQSATWNVERGEASIPDKRAALAILRGVLGDGENLVCADTDRVTASDEGATMRLEAALRRRLERMREPQIFHPIEPGPRIATGYPAREDSGELGTPDVARRHERRQNFDRDLHRRIAKKIPVGGLSALEGGPPSQRDGRADARVFKGGLAAAPGEAVVDIREDGDDSFRPDGMKTRHSNLTPGHFPGRPKPQVETGKEMKITPPIPPGKNVIRLGDSLAARARKLRAQKDDSPDGDSPIRVTGRAK